MKPEEQLSAGFDKWAEESGLEFSNGVNSFVNWTPNTRAIAFKAYRAAYAQARREALEQALEIVCEAKENICAGGLAENRQYEESIVGPHLDGVADEIDALIKD